MTHLDDMQLVDVLKVVQICDLLSALPIHHSLTRQYLQLLKLNGGCQRSEGAHRSQKDTIHSRQL